MKIFDKNKQSGFSLVELMIVVGIIGVLATLALPRFKQFQSKAKMAEAMNVLQHVYTLEQSYSLDNNAYITVGNLGASTGSAAGGNVCSSAGSADLGLSIEPCVPGAPTPRFQYQVTGGGAGFLAIARTGAGANNRICLTNPAFSIGLNEKNMPKWAAGTTPTTDGMAAVNRVCPN